MARTRSISERAESLFDEVNEDFDIWYQTERASLWQAPTVNSETDRARLQNLTLATRIEENLDIIVELQTNESFRNRESAISTMASIRDISRLATILALLIAVSLSIWVGLTIIRPLKSAANAAQQISKGRLDIDIPRGGRDETGLLLRAMRVMQDNIRARIEREKSLRTLAQDRLSDSLENSKDAILLTDQNGKIIVANPDVKSLFADLTDTQSIVGRQRGDFINADGIPKGVAERDGDREFRLLDGRWFRVNASDTREDGRLYIWNEMTQIRQTATRLLAAKDAAESANRAKTLFLAAMSHELKTPLNAVIGLADAVGSKIRGGGNETSEDMADMMDLIVSSGEHINQIVSDVLEVASDDKSSPKHDLDRVEFSTIVDRTIQEFKKNARRAEVRLLWELPSSPISILGDAADLKVLVTKILDNAIKFNRPGGSAKIQLQKIENGTVRLIVIDNGIGIASEDLSRILEPFQQISQGYTRAVDGTGLGLAVASRIAQRHNTRIQFQSRFGKGSVFSVIFDDFKTSEAFNNVDTGITQNRSAA